MEEQSLPDGFVPLGDVSNRMNQEVNIIGVVTDFLPPSMTRGTDYQLTFSIQDWSNYYSSCSEQIKFFRPKREQLPTIRGTGDVVILRRMKVKSYNGITVVLSGHFTEWIVFPASTIPTEAPDKSSKPKFLCPPSPARTRPPTPEEWLYAVSICNVQDKTTFTAPIDPAEGLAKTLPSTQYLDAAPVTKRSFALIKDVVADTFYDLAGEVIKVHATSSDRIELYITDYTSNIFLYNYEWGRGGDDDDGRDGDTYNYAPRRRKQEWPGPYGKMTIQIALWPPHSGFALNEVKVKDFVWLRNVRIKYKEGRLEGTMYNGSKFTERIDVGIIGEKDTRVKEAMDRKERYWKKAKAEGMKFLEDVRGEKRKDEAQPKGRAKKRKKQLPREEDQRVLESAQIKKRETKKIEKHEINSHIRSAHPAVKWQPLSEIENSDRRWVKTPGGVEYQLPFHVAKYRASVRVVDYFPPKLEDFAVPCEPSSDDELSESQDDGPEDHPKRWEWRFCLLVEDGALTTGDVSSEDRTRLKVFVAKHDAEFLLKMEAENLRNNHTLLAELREKLFILWGDLEERKTAAAKALKSKDPNKNQGLSTAKNDDPSTKAQQRPSGKPFECCLKEYGVRVPRNESTNEASKELEPNAADGMVWEKRFRIFGTTIL